MVERSLLSVSEAVLNVDRSSGSKRVSLTSSQPGLPRIDEQSSYGVTSEDGSCDDGANEGEWGLPLFPVATSTSINRLPAEILLRIFGFLDPLTLNDIWQVCTRWKLLAQSRDVWITSFANEFYTSESFPSVSNSKLWIVEYEARLRTKRRWLRLKLKSQFYKLLSALSSRLMIKADFDTNKLLGLFYDNEFFACHLVTGKNQTYVLNSNMMYTRKTPKFNTQYLIQINGQDDSIWIKNLHTAKSLGARALSWVRCDTGAAQSAEELCLDINEDAHSSSDFDFISGESGGTVRCWTFKGRLVKEYKVSHSPIMFVRSDFRSKIVAVDSNQSLHFVNCINGDITHTETYALLEGDFDELRDDHLTTLGSRWFVEFDFGFDKVTLVTLSRLMVLDYIKGTLHKYMELPAGVTIADAVLQTTRHHRTTRFDTLLAGMDGLMHCVLLTNDVIMVWNIRDDTPGSHIVPQCQFRVGDCVRGPVNAMALNSSVLLLGYSNGYSEIRDLFSGEYVRTCTKNFPKSMDRTYVGAPVEKIILNPDPAVPNGVVVSLNLVHYFQLGDVAPRRDTKKRKPPRTLNSQKVGHRAIMSQLDDYKMQEEERQESQRLQRKYNGDNTGFDREIEDEMTIALALSKSETECQRLHEDDQMRLALELSASASEATPDTASQEDEEFARQLAEVLRLSLEES
jgi:ubiquitin ligase complex F-box protein UFO1